MPRTPPPRPAPPRAASLLLALALLGVGCARDALPVVSDGSVDLAPLADAVGAADAPGDAPPPDLVAPDLILVRCDPVDGGSCGPEAGCPPGQGRCTCGCVPLDTAENCGACGYRCPAGASCERGGCSSSCREDERSCDGTCRSVTSDPRNCGACGRACAAGQVCRRGACAADCGDLTRCGDGCVDLQNDLDHCGACDALCCPGTFQCRFGRCSVFDCAAGITACSEVVTQCGQTCTRPLCTDLGTNPNHCGACNTRCAPSQICQQGLCR